MYFFICLMIIIGFSGCSEDDSETQDTGLIGTINPSGVTARVEITKGGKVISTADVDTDGNYKFVNLSEGEYDLVITADGYIIHSQKVTVEKGQITEVPTVTLKESAGTVITITGKVVDSETKEPIFDALVVVDYEDNSMDTSVHTERDGSFSISIQPDLLPNIIISKDGYEPCEVFPANISKIEISLTKKLQNPTLPPQPPVGNVLLKVGDTAPDFTLKKLDGGDLRLNDTRGKVVFLDFWASWCGPCKSSVPHTQKLYEKYKSDGLMILGINVWEQGGIDTVRKFKDDYKITYDILLGTGTDIEKLYGVEAIPTFWILDKKGVITWIQIGFGPGIELTMEKQILSAMAKG